MNKKSVTVIIPIFGDVSYFMPFAQRAYYSVADQTMQPESVLISINDGMQSARNNAGLNANTEYIIFLDADDTLDKRYIEHITNYDNADIVVPSVHRIYSDGRIDKDQAPYLPKNLMIGNYVVIGALLRTEHFKKMGGFHDYDALEDWDFYLRSEEADARFVQGTKAIYEIHIRENSRNTSLIAQEIVQGNAKKRRNIQ
jgi:glycosyltransferase involved in cell wall biosynthesis